MRFIQACIGSPQLSQLSLTRQSREKNKRTGATNEINDGSASSNWVLAVWQLLSHLQQMNGSSAHHCHFYRLQLCTPKRLQWKRMIYKHKNVGGESKLSQRSATWSKLVTVGRSAKVNSVVLCCASFNKVPEDRIGRSTRVTPCSDGPRWCCKPVRCHSCTRHSSRAPGAKRPASFFHLLMRLFAFVHVSALRTVTFCSCLSTF